MALVFYSKLGAGEQIPPGSFLIWDADGWLVCRREHLDSGALGQAYYDGQLELLEPTPGVASLEAERLLRRVAALPRQPGPPPPPDAPAPRRPPRPRLLP